ncbi:MAG TPA: hypothetical protein VN830_11230 [Verrucomicrobiae bacterium]|nr:hypothetical protein [Verrucomicrobiae bacterium]
MPNRAKTKPATKAQPKAAPQAASSLESVYSEIEAILKRHAPPFLFQEVGVQNKKNAQLTVPKPVVIPGAYGGKPVPVQLAAVILQKGYVGLYLMCIYMNDAAKKKLPPNLMKLLQGKTCFHVKKLDDGLRADIEAALQLGTKAYKDRGWL